MTEQVAGGVTPGGQEGGMAEGQQTGKAEQQVEGHRKQGKTQDLHQEDRVHHEGRGQQQQQQHAVHHQFLAVLDLLLLDNGFVDIGRINRLVHDYASLPNRPVGRIISTRTITRKITAEDAGG